MGRAPKTKEEKDIAIARAKKAHRQRKKGSGLRQVLLWTAWEKGIAPLVAVKLTGAWSKDILDGNVLIELVADESGKMDIVMRSPIRDGPDIARKDGESADEFHIQEKDHGKDEKGGEGKN